jgi:zinc-binding in reverse transcriptase
MYAMLATAEKIRSPVAHVWKSKVRLTLRVFFILLLHDKVLTKDVMIRRKFTVTQGCVLCGQCPSESANHLFCLCPVAVQIWKAMGDPIGMRMIAFRDTGTYLASMPSGHRKHDRHNLTWWQTHFIVVMWHL